MVGLSRYTIDMNSINEASLRLRTGAKWNYFADDVIPAWVADMDFEVAEPIQAALQSRLDHSDLGYPVGHERSGLPELFVARVAERFGWAIEARDVVIINDVVQGLYLGLHTLCERGDEVLIQTPIYPPFLHAAEQTGRRAVCCALKANPQAGEYQIDFDQLRESISATTRVLMLCNPHNPSGRAFHRDELEQLAELACRHDLVVISDEIHADLVLDERPHIPIASLGEDIAARTLTLMSASKAFNIAGLCMAFVHCGSAALKERFEAIPPHTRGGTNALSVAAVDAAWRHGAAWQAEVLATLRTNRDTVKQHVTSRWPEVRHISPQATYLAWLDVSALGLGEAPHKTILNKSRVALSDGRTFGSEGNDFVRLNFATSPALLTEILTRLDVALGSA